MPATKTNLRAESTQAKVARLAGVSQSAVSMALSGSGTISEDTRTRILEVARLLNYYHAASTTKMARLRTYEKCSVNIAVNWMAEENGKSLFQDPFFAKILHGIVKECSSAGFGIVPLSATRRNLLDYAVTIKCDGAILMPIEAEEDMTVGAPCTVPIVTIMHQYPYLASVTIDENRAMSLAFDHLVANGHRKIGYIGPYQGITAESRMKYFQNSFRRFNMRYEEKLVCLSYSCNSLETGRLAFKKLWDEQQRRPTALVAYNDMVALGIYEAAAELKVRVPEDVSVISFSDINEAQNCVPALTTVSLNLEEMGRQAVNLIQGFVIEQKYVSEGRQVDVSLVQRESVRNISESFTTRVRQPLERLRTAVLGAVDGEQSAKE